MVQIDMEMPRGCDTCPLCTTEGYYICQMTGHNVSDEWDLGIRYENCPLESVENLREELEKEILNKKQQEIGVENVFDD